MKRSRAKLILFSAAGLSGLMAAVAGLSFSATGLKGVQAQRQDRSPAPTLSALVALPPEKIAPEAIARMNLLCQQGLSGSEDLDINPALNLVEQMAARVKSETQRHLYRFERNPGEFENSEGFFRMVMMGVALAEISAAEEAAEGYLKSLSPAEELAVFLSIRGMCLRESGHLAEAAESFATASRLSPGTQSYQQMADALGLKHGTERRSAGDKSASIQGNASHSKL